jgi:hypothetical protein
MPSLSDKDMLNYIWNYFQLHANQRMSVFNFYVSFSSLITIPLILTFKNEKNLHLLGILLGFLLFMLSIVFWKLDVRTRMLIKISQDALKQLENNFNSKNDEITSKLRILQLDEDITKNMKKEENFPNNLLLTYANCFNLVFFVFGMIGMLFTLYHLYNIVLNPELIWQFTSFDISNDTIKI